MSEHVFDPRGELEVELNRLELRFADTRVRERHAIEALSHSIEGCGQLVACIAVSESSVGESVNAARLTLIDGYRRVAALRRLGCDLARVEIWYCDVAHGVLAVLAGSHGRAYAPIEQALLLRELTGLGLSQQEIARRSGRDVSWVSRRLQLLSDLPDDVLAAVRAGTLSCWAATRVFSPLARANSEHAAALLAAVYEHALSTRELRAWLEHYRHASHGIRERMLQHPKLFLQAQQARQQQQRIDELRGGPEGQCLEELQRVRWLLKRVRERLRALPTESLGSQLLEAIDAVNAEIQRWQRERSPATRPAPSAPPSDAHHDHP